MGTRKGFVSPPFCTPAHLLISCKHQVPEVFELIGLQMQIRRHLQIVKVFIWQKPTQFRKTQRTEVLTFQQAARYVYTDSTVTLIFSNSV